MRRHLLGLLTSSAALLLLATACEPAPVQVRMDNTSFAPPTVTASRGGSVRWTNDDFLTHTTTGDAPLNLWHSSVSPGGNFAKTFVAAGTYAYHCEIHFGMNGTVKVPLAVSPSSGTTATTFTVTFASQTAPTGFQYVLQKKDPGGAFQAFRTGTAATTTFKPTRTGTHQFRAQLKRTGSSAASGFSDVQSIAVS